MKQWGDIPTLKPRELKTACTSRVDDRLLKRKCAAAGFPVALRSSPLSEEPGQACRQVPPTFPLQPISSPEILHLPPQVCSTRSRITPTLVSPAKNVTDASSLPSDVNNGPCPDRAPYLWNASKPSHPAWGPPRPRATRGGRPLSVRSSLGQTPCDLLTGTFVTCAHLAVS